jgi:hypothetical protein
MDKLAEFSNNDAKSMEKQKKSCKKWMSKNNRNARKRVSGFACFSRKQKLVPGIDGLTDDGKKELVSHGIQRFCKRVLS